MSTMPPISSFGSAPVMTLSSPAALMPAIQSRKSLLGISVLLVSLKSAGDLIPAGSPCRHVLLVKSVGREAHRLDEPRIHSDFPLELLFEGPRRDRCGRSADAFQALAHARRFQRLDDLLVQPVHDR